MKQCSKCGLTLPISEFPVRSKSTYSASAYCRSCQREYNRQHYRANKVAHNKRRHVNQLRYKRENRKNVLAYLLEHPCVDCGENDPLVLEFDHVRGIKAGEISIFVNTGRCWAKIMREIEKCDVRCANCHRRKTARDFKWFKGDFGA